MSMRVRLDTVLVFIIAVAGLVFIGELIYYVRLASQSSAADSTIDPPAVGRELPRGLVPAGTRIVAVIMPPCIPCDQSVPAWNDLAEANVPIVGLAGTTDVDVRLFEENTGIRPPVIVAGGDEFLGVIGIRTIPSTLVMDQHGRIIFVYEGVLGSAQSITERFPAGLLGKGPP